VNVLNEKMDVVWTSEMRREEFVDRMKVERGRTFDSAEEKNKKY
jgi:hypothetical protein